MSTAQKELNNRLSELKQSIETHVASYMANLQDELKAKLENTKHDFFDDNAGKIIMDYEDLQSIFLTGKNSLSDSIDAFYDDSIPDCQFDSEYGFSELFDNVESEMENHLREDGEENICGLARQLEESYQRLSMGVTSEIDTIIEITDKLIVEARRI